MIALCVGHSRHGDSGATAYDGTSEWDFNAPVAHLVRRKLGDCGIDALVIDDYKGLGYGSAMRWLGDRLLELGVTTAVELHFNAAGPTAQGYEYLHWHRSRRGQKLAQALHDAHRASVPRATSRGIKPRDFHDRGSLFLRLTHCPAVIAEPFFGTNDLDAVRYFASPELLANIYAEGLQNYLNDAQ